MNILKKITGIVLLLIAVLLSLATLATTINAVAETLKEFNDSGSASGIGYAIGSLFVIAILVAIIYFVTKTGLKLIRKKVVYDDVIGEIGSGH